MSRSAGGPIGTPPASNGATEPPVPTDPPPVPALAPPVPPLMSAPPLPASWLAAPPLPVPDVPLVLEGPQMELAHGSSLTGSPPPQARGSRHVAAVTARWMSCFTGFTLDVGAARGPERAQLPVLWPQTRNRIVPEFLIRFLIVGHEQLCPCRFLPQRL